MEEPERLRPAVEERSNAGTGIICRAWLAPILRDRGTVFALLAVAVIVGGAHLWGISLWSCPFLRLTGLPCPGCGLTRGCAAFLRGEWVAAVQYHAFAPLFVTGGIFAGIISLMPRPLHTRVVNALAAIECRTGLGFWILTGFLIYVLTRLAEF